ncbi:MAG: hypothetical protein EBX50_11950 [Chitinophagia bacterium]|nr:hypothetical protein [Chitinophagia bacterium]
MLSVASAPVASANLAAGGSANAEAVAASADAVLYVATKANTTGSYAMGDTSTVALVNEAALSVGLLYHNETSGTAQTATMLTGGVLSLYAPVTTNTAFVATAGTFAGLVGGNPGATQTAYADPASAAIWSINSTGGSAAITATAVAVRWSAPSTPGTYAIYTYKQTNPYATFMVSPTGGTLTAAITVTVVAASAGGTYSAANSNCVTKTSVTASSLTSTDTTSSSVAAGSQWYIGFLLNDAYGADLSTGALVATATDGATVALTTDGSAVAAGTGTTAVASDKGESDMVRIDAKTTGVPSTTTVTISHNGTVVCTKTVKFRGFAATMEISNVGVVDLSGSDTDVKWLGEEATEGGVGIFATSQTAVRKGHFYMTLKDTAGNIVLPASTDTFAIDSSTVTTTVTGGGSTYSATTNPFATSTTSTSQASKTVGTFTCGASAGSSSIKMVHTSAATGTKVTSPAFTARCADDPSSFTASWDKATYTAGDIATLTLEFKDSKGNLSNTMDAPGAHTIVAPLLTNVSTTGSATKLTDANGRIQYTYTVGTTAGSYAAIIEFPGLLQKATASYKIV